MLEKNPSPPDTVPQLLRKADHWANFGTLTSLISTASYFVEQTFYKKLPPALNRLTLGMVGTGIFGVFVSFFYRLKAGQVALENETRMTGKAKLASIDAPSADAQSTTLPDRRTTWAREVQCPAPERGR